MQLQWKRWALRALAVMSQRPYRLQEPDVDCFAVLAFIAALFRSVLWLALATLLTVVRLAKQAAVVVNDLVYNEGAHHCHNTKQHAHSFTLSLTVFKNKRFILSKGIEKF